MHQHALTSSSPLIASRLEGRTAYFASSLALVSGDVITGFSGVKGSRHEAAHACLWLVCLVDLQDLQASLEFRGK